MADDLALVEAYAGRAGEQHAWLRATDFMIATLSAMRAKLPGVAQAGLETARRFRNGSAGAAELERARVACWEYLDDRNASTDLAKPEICAIRAVIFMLYDGPQQGIDSTDLIAGFLEVANRFEDHSNGVGGLLERYFGSAPAT